MWDCPLPIGQDWTKACRWRHLATYRTGVIEPPEDGRVWGSSVRVPVGLGAVVGVMVSPLITIGNMPVIWSPVESERRTVNWKLPPSVGVPKMTPGLVTLNPSGIPANGDHTYGGIPPEAC